MDIAVVVPTRNRAALLGPCLVSLCQQTLDPSRFEVCVVNNGSTDVTPQVLQIITKNFPNHRVFMVDEPELGVAKARNTGIRKTSAPLIVQTDDDVMASPDWLASFINSYAVNDPKIGKIGGDVEPVWGASRPAWLTDEMLPLLTATSGFGKEPKFVDEGLLECNGCYRRDAIEEAGLFPTSLGRKGSSLLSAEHAVDLVMQMNGWQLFYDPSIVVKHNIHPDRLTPAWFRRRYFWQGVSNFATLTYLKTKGITFKYNLEIDMPFARENWAFINNANHPPTQDELNRLRSLGFVLANSGFVPVV